MAPTSRDLSSEDASLLGSRTAKVATSIFTSKMIIFLVIGLSFVFVARILGPTTYGVYTLAIATAGFFGAVGDLGIGTMMVKRISEYIAKKQTDKIKQLLVNGFAIVIIESAIFTIIAFLLSNYVAVNVLHNPGDTLALQLVSIDIILGTVWSVAYSSLIAFGKGRQIALIVAIQSLIQAGLSIILAIILTPLGFGAIAPIIGLLASFAVSLLYAVHCLRKDAGMKSEKIKIDVKQWRGILEFSIPIGASATFPGLISNYSLIFLGSVSTALIVGNFGAAYRAINVFDVILGSIGFALLPMFSSVLSSKRITKEVSKYFNYSVYFSCLIAAPIILYIVMLSTQLSYTVFSGNYVMTPLYLSIMAIGVALITFWNYASNLLIGAGKVRKVFWYSFIGALVQFVLLFVLVKPLNGLGLTLTMFIIMPLTICLLYVREITKFFKMRIEFRSFFKVFICSIFSALFIIPLTAFFGSNTIPLLIAAVIEQMLIYPIVLGLSGTIDKERLEIIDKVVKELPLVGVLMKKLTAYTGFFLR
ncbi:MAG: oligosaccharide flippase family protein [Candidatus Micrarchaeales archaeon]